MGLFRSSSVGDAMFYKVTQCSSALSEVFPVDCKKQAGGSMYRILEEPSVVSTAWKHDEELGRGYLLISTSWHKGKVWQWETGGGPIPIGRTLHMQDSGCRSKNTCNRLDTGSGGIAVDIWHEQPRLLVSEWGEKRVVRLEPESGARTPLIVGEYSAGFLLEKPRQLLLTAFGDLIILDSHQSKQEDDNSFLESSTLWQLPQISKVPPLASLAESRLAHEWTALNTTRVPQLVLEQNRIGGVALVPKEWQELYVTMNVGEKTVLGALSLGDEDTPRQSRLLMDYSQYADIPGPIVVDEAGRLYLGIKSGILVLEPPNKVIGAMQMPNITDPITSLTMGEDRFLYFTTAEALYRMKTRVKPLQTPTNLVVK